MYPWPSCNGRTRNAVSMSIWVCTRPHYFYCPSPDFTTSIVSQSVTNNRCPPHVGGTRGKWGGTPKYFRPALRAGILPPLANSFRRHCYHCRVSYRYGFYEYPKLNSVRWRFLCILFRVKSGSSETRRRIALLLLYVVSATCTGPSGDRVRVRLG